MNLASVNNIVAYKAVQLYTAALYAALALSKVMERYFSDENRPQWRHAIRILASTDDRPIKFQSMQTTSIFKLGVWSQISGVRDAEKTANGSPAVTWQWQTGNSRHNLECEFRSSTTDCQPGKECQNASVMWSGISETSRVAGSLGIVIQWSHSSIVMPTPDDTSSAS